MGRGRFRAGLVSGEAEASIDRGRDGRRGCLWPAQRMGKFGDFFFIIVVFYNNVRASGYILGRVARGRVGSDLVVGCGSGGVQLVWAGP